ncbi:polyprenyl synthetase family protein [Deinococcus maricopensis]|uniref:Trans-hexaprenyltranstransferase n=1 Tax=Deinococcus maricopensis (strain DSM 21211 / LMG 22137 / NRRL B-23946 / LB-34) TaxID=709986 RepID=E8U7S1_DEIML|nr:polyprenyl synthetase family protein [Deinococcus maricopensis]ADV67110.1 Trans-hexaprenyltranstransferase [Deinococcus maricopensis DSM 21211]
MNGALSFPTDAFEARLREVLRSQVEFIELIGDDLVTAGGKRTRPALTYLAFRALGLDAHPQEHDVAVAVELLHSASLLHDDLIDDADTRRGAPTAFRRFGNVVSVMSGDYMLSKLLVLLASTTPGLVRAFGETAAHVCEGEVLQFQVAAYGEYSHEHYLNVIYGKTAALVELAASAPALLVGASDAHQRALADFGREYGMAFQMQDDLLDLAGTEALIGKPVGGDLREGKATLPILYLLEGPDGDEVRAILERRAAHEGDVDRVRALAFAQGAVDRTRAAIQDRALRAVTALRALPASPARDRLEAFAAQAADRVK